MCMCTIHYVDKLIFIYIWREWWKWGRKKQNDNMMAKPNIFFLDLHSLCPPSILYLLHVQLFACDWVCTTNFVVFGVEPSNMKKKLHCVYPNRALILPQSIFKNVYIHLYFSKRCSQKYGKYKCTVHTHRDRHTYIKRVTNYYYKHFHYYSSWFQKSSIFPLEEEINPYTALAYASNTLL